MASNYTGVGDMFDLIAVKQRIDPDDVYSVELAVLLALDAAKRGAAPAPVANTLTEHLATSAAIWSQMGNKPLYTAAAEAWQQLRKACMRETVLLDLTTGEYAAIRKAISYYVRALPKFEVGAFTRAQGIALARLRE